MTLIVERPDGVEFLRRTLSDGGLGGYSDDVTLEANAMRGSWRIKLYADPEGCAARRDIGAGRGLRAGKAGAHHRHDRDAFSIRANRRAIDLEARYLYGASAPDLVVEGEVILTPTDTLAAYHGYSVRPHRRERRADRASRCRSMQLTDEDGKATFDVTLAGAALVDQAVRRHAHHPRRRHQRPRGRAHAVAAGCRRRIR